MKIDKTADKIYSELNKRLFDPATQTYNVSSWITVALTIALVSRKLLKKAPINDQKQVLQRVLSTVSSRMDLQEDVRQELSNNAGLVVDVVVEVFLFLYSNRETALQCLTASLAKAKLLC